MTARADLAALLDAHAPLDVVDGCPELLAHQARDVYALWEALERARSIRLAEVPFWALVWPAARVLARWILDHPELVRGRRVLEIGCGGAVASVAAARAGAATVVANDIDPDCAFVAECNAAANGTRLQRDTRDRIARGDLDVADVILLADGFYERTVAERTLSTLRRARARGIEVIIADSGRPFAPPPDALETLHEAEQRTDELAEGVATRRVRVGRLR